MLLPLVNLDFNFRNSLKFTSFQEELASKRINFHSLSDSTIQQVLQVLKILKDTRSIAEYKLGEKKQVDPWQMESIESEDKPAQATSKLGKPLKLGILLPDIFPESSETWVYALLHSLKDILAFDQIELISRRVVVDKLKTPKEFETIPSSWNFTNPSYIDQFDLVVIVCQSMYAYMLEEIFKVQECPLTLVMPCFTGIPLQKLTTMLKSDLIILPKFQFEPIQEIKKQDVLYFISNISINRLF